MAKNRSEGITAYTKTLIAKMTPSERTEFIEAYVKYEEAERDNWQFLDEKALTLMTALSAGCVAAILGHKLHPGAPVNLFLAAAVVFAVSVVVMFSRIWFRPYTLLPERLPKGPQHDNPETVKKNYKTLGKVSAGIAVLGLALALLGAVSEVTCYAQAEGAQCTRIVPRFMENL